MQNKFYIKTAKIQNFKCFEDISFELSQGINVFFGLNGSGKTSLLEAIRSNLGGFFSSSNFPTINKSNIRYNQLRIKDNKAADSSIVLLNIENSLFGKKETISAKRVFKRVSKSNNSRNGLSSLIDLGELIYNNLNNNKGTNSPLLAYYSTRRLFTSASQSEKQRIKNTEGQLNGYLLCFSEESIIPALNEWLAREITTRAVEEDLKVNVNYSVLNCIDEAISRAFSIIEEESVETKLYVKANEFNEPYLAMKGGESLSLSQYSDGYRNLFYLICDLVWRASILNQTINLKQIQEETSGIVMIDEVDLHLHPRWQKNVLEVLVNIFPNVQFLITTHSPIVLSSAHKYNLYMLKTNNSNDSTIEPVKEENKETDVKEILLHYMRSTMLSKRAHELVEAFYSIIEDDFKWEKDKIKVLLETVNEIKQILPATEFERMKIEAIMDINLPE